MVELRARRHRRRRAARRCSRAACGRSSRTSSPTSRTRPATRSAARSASSCSQLAAEYGFTIFEDDPYIEIRFTGEPLPTMLSLDGPRRRARRLRLVVLQDGLPGHPRRLPGRPRGADRDDRPQRDEHVHLAEHGRPVDRLPVLRERPDRRRREDRQRGARRARARRSPRRSPSTCPTRASRRPRAATSCGSSCRRAPTCTCCSTAAAEHDVTFVKGTDFLLEGGENTLRLAYSGVTPEQIGEGIRRLAAAYAELYGPQGVRRSATPACYVVPHGRLGPRAAQPHRPGDRRDRGRSARRPDGPRTPGRRHRAAAHAQRAPPDRGHPRRPARDRRPRAQARRGRRTRTTTTPGSRPTT